MAEEEELILRVRLDDQSRAAIAALQEQLRGVGGGLADRLTGVMDQIRDVPAQMTQAMQGAVTQLQDVQKQLADIPQKMAAGMQQTVASLQQAQTQMSALSSSTQAAAAKVGVVPGQMAGGINALIPALTRASFVGNLFSNMAVEMIHSLRDMAIDLYHRATDFDGFTKSMKQMGDVAHASGQEVGQYKIIADEIKTFGVNSEEAAQSAVKLGEARADLEYGMQSQIRQQFLQSVPTESFQNAKKFMDDLADRTKTPAQFINRVQEELEALEEGLKERGESPQAIEREKRRLTQPLGLDWLLQAPPGFRAPEATKEQIELHKQLTAEAQRYQMQQAQTAKNWQNIGNSLLSMNMHALGLNTEFSITERLTKSIADTLEAWDISRRTAKPPRVLGEKEEVPTPEQRIPTKEATGVMPVEQAPIAPPALPKPGEPPPPPVPPERSEGLLGWGRRLFGMTPEQIAKQEKDIQQLREQQATPAESFPRPEQAAPPVPTEPPESWADWGRRHLLGMTREQYAEHQKEMQARITKQPPEEQQPTEPSTPQAPVVGARFADIPPATGLPEVQVTPEAANRFANFPRSTRIEDRRGETPLDKLSVGLPSTPQAQYAAQPVAAEHAMLLDKNNRSLRELTDILARFLRQPVATQMGGLAAGLGADEGVMQPPKPAATDEPPKPAIVEEPPKPAGGVEEPPKPAIVEEPPKPADESLKSAPVEEPPKPGVEMAEPPKPAVTEEPPKPGVTAEPPKLTTVEEPPKPAAAADELPKPAIGEEPSKPVITSEPPKPLELPYELQRSLDQMTQAAIATPLETGRQKDARIAQLEKWSDATMPDVASKLDEAASQNINIEGTGRIAVDVNAPSGTNVTAQAEGFFKSTEITRQTQMLPADMGASFGTGIGASSGASSNGTV